MHVIHLGKQTVPAEIDYPREDRRVDGVPERTSWTHYSNASGSFNAGIWACEKAAGRFVLRMTAPSSSALSVGVRGFMPRMAALKNSGPAMPRSFRKDLWASLKCWSR